MVFCNYCGAQESMPFTCKLCEAKYCSRHRLPEAHECPFIGQINNPEYRRQKAVESQRATISAQDVYRRSEMQYKKDRVEEIIKEHPQFLTYGSERVDILIGLGLIVLSATFMLFITQVINIIGVIIYGFMIGPAFILHELGHKYSAQYYGKPARFTLTKQGVRFTLILTLLPWIAGGPGPVTIFDQMDQRQSGIVSVCGPAVNIGLGFLYYILYLIFLPFLGVFAELFFFGMFINAGLGVFNMLPVSILDGKKVFAWSKPIWIATMLVLVSQIILAFSL
jgi:Zn-dependent protease